MAQAQPERRIYLNDEHYLIGDSLSVTLYRRGIKYPVIIGHYPTVKMALERFLDVKLNTAQDDADGPQEISYLIEKIDELKKTIETWFEDFKKTCEKDPETLLIERTGRGEGHGKGEGEIVA